VRATPQIGIARCRRLRNGEQPPACGKRGQPPGVGRRARQRSRARGHGPADAPGADSSRSFPADLALVVTHSSRFTHPLCGTSRLLPSASARGSARCLACRRRALEDVEKVVTAASQAGFTGSLHRQGQATFCGMSLVRRGRPPRDDPR
jgi:hypothetical protein